MKSIFELELDLISAAIAFVSKATAQREHSDAAPDFTELKDCVDAYRAGLREAAIAKARADHEEIKKLMEPEFDQIECHGCDRILPLKDVSVHALCPECEQRRLIGKK